MLARAADEKAERVRLLVDILPAAAAGFLAAGMRAYIGYRKRGHVRHFNGTIDLAAAAIGRYAYSLVHDDMPCMDDDDMPRTTFVHKAWDEATAVLAGDALQTMGFELVLNDQAGSPMCVQNWLKHWQSYGAHGMVLGQALDIAAETAETP